MFHRFAAALLVLGVLDQSFVIAQSTDRPTATGAATIVGVVLNERREAAGRMTVQAFPASAVDQQAETRAGAPPRLATMRPSGSAQTDNAGRFRITGLQPGEYVLAAESASPLPAGVAPRGPIHAITFYPSTANAASAVTVAVSAGSETTVVIELVRTRGARLTGSVVSPSGSPTAGMRVRLSHRFGGFGSGNEAAVVDASGRFEIPGVAPGWYQLSIGIGPGPDNQAREFVEKEIEVTDADIEGLSLVLGSGATISGHILLEAGVTDLSPLVLRVNASSPAFSSPKQTRAAIAEDWSFRMSGLSGRYQFALNADRALAVAVTRVRVDGVETAADSAVDIGPGAREVVLFVAPRAAPKAAERTETTAALVEAFKAEKVFYRQMDIGKDVVARHDASVLPALSGLLSLDDRHARGNAAFVFAGLGDPRGFQVITEILIDRAERSPNGGVTHGNWTLQEQIRSDRYYAAHLLGDLRDPRGVAILVPLLKDQEVREVVPWALSAIGDRRAIRPLIAALDDPSPTMRVLSIYALETLRATEALPRLTELVNDLAKTNFGAQVSVGEAARAAIATLR